MGSQRFAAASTPSTSRVVVQSRDNFVGTIGKSATVTTNYYPMRSLRNVELYIYEMRFFTNGTQRLRRSLCRQLFWQSVQSHSQIFGGDECKTKFVFDDVSRLYSLFPLNDFLRKPITDSPIKFELKYREEARDEKTAEVELAKVDEFVVQEPYTAPMLQFFNTLVTQAARCWTMKLSEKCYAETNRIYVLPTNATCFQLGNCTQLIHGIRTSVRIDSNGLPKLNVDLVNSSFLRMEMELIEYYSELMCGRRLTDADLLRLRDYSMSEEQAKRMDVALAGFLGLPLSSSSGYALVYLASLTIMGGRCVLGARLKTKHPPIRYYNYSHLIQQHAKNYLFEHPVHGRISVAEYFYRHHNEMLRFPYMPLVKLQNNEHDICMPMEMLSIAEAPQRIRKLLPADVLRKVVKRTSFYPAKHFQCIQDLVGTTRLIDNPFLKEFGVDFPSYKFMEVDSARVLPRPATFFNKDSIRQRDLRMFRKPPNDNILFAVICLDLPESAVPGNIEAAINYLSMSCQRNLPVRFYDPDNPYHFFDDFYFNSSTFRAYLKNVCETIASESSKINPLFIFLCEENYDNYDDIKTVCEVEMGLVSQFINYPRLERIRVRDISVINNIMLKINLKLGGVNNAIRPDDIKWQTFTNPRAPTLFFGITVLHPERGEDFPSVAAVSYSLDVRCTTFCGEFLKTSLSFERGKGYGGGNQRVCEITPLILKAISDFSHENRITPKHLFFLREGLSGSQIEVVAGLEHCQIANAINQFAEKYKISFRPTITYIVIQKRHGTRFYMDKGQFERLTGDQRGANGNVPSGTVVDTVITGAQKLDNPNENEKDFYLCSQRGILGTSRPAYYRIYLDEWELSADEVQFCMFALCHLIGRSFNAVSVPAPIHYSNLLAARARRYIRTRNRDRERENANDDVKVHEALDRQLYFT